MTSLKGIILACITFLVTVGVVITYLSQQDRYALYAQEKGIFVFDRKTATLNFCDSQICQMIRPVLPLQETEMFMAGMAGMPAQNSVVNGSVPVSSPVMVPQGGVMQPMGTQPMMRQPSSMGGVPQQNPIQIASPLPAPNASGTTAPTKGKKSSKKARKNDGLADDTSSEDSNTNDDISSADESDDTNDDE